MTDRSAHTLPAPDGAAVRQRILLLALAGIAAALISSAQVYHNWSSYDASARFSTIFGVKLVEWGMWAVAIPLVVWLDRTHGYQQRSKAGATVVHLFAAVCWFLVINLVLTLLTRLTDPAAAGDSLFRIFSNRLIFKLPAGLGIYGFLLAGYGVFHLRSARLADSVRKAQLESELTTARLANIQMQLQPHFLFNTLHSIGALVREGQGDRAVDMIAELSELLRRALRTVDRQEVMLDEELAFLDHYVRIQQVRFADRLVVTYQIDPGMRRALIPALILQPLVENAIRHGLERTGRRVQIVIGGSKVDEHLVLEVVDDGPGAAPDTIVEGVGLGNARSRLLHLYGDRQTFSFGPGPHGGTSVRLAIPLRLAGNPQAHES